MCPYVWAHFFTFCDIQCSKFIYKGNMSLFKTERALGAQWATTQHLSSKVTILKNKLENSFLIFFRSVFFCVKNCQCVNIQPLFAMKRLAKVIVQQKFCCKFQPLDFDMVYKNILEHFSLFQNVTQIFPRKTRTVQRR